MYIMISAVIVKGDTKSKDASQVQNTENFIMRCVHVFFLYFFVFMQLADMVIMSYTFYLIISEEFDLCFFITLRVVIVFFHCFRQ